MYNIEVYTRTIWLFAITVTALMLILCYLKLAKDRAMAREAYSLGFTHLAIEGMETERRRIACELHDIVLPKLANAEVSGIIRAICTELMPPDFTKLSFADSLRDVYAQFSKNTGVFCACLIDEEINFSAIGTGKLLHLYRIVQESLNNIKKHSKASRTSLVVRKADCPQAGANGIIICISDNGKGIRDLPGLRFDKGYAEGVAASEGLGMKSMRQRAAIIGAGLKFVSEPGNGLMVQIELGIA